MWMYDPDTLEIRNRNNRHLIASAVSALDAPLLLAAPRMLVLLRKAPALMTNQREQTYDWINEADALIAEIEGQK